MSDIIETISFSSASKFLDYLQLRNQRWLPINATSSPWVFRGQSNSEWELQSSALRTGQTWFNNSKKENFEKVSQSIDGIRNQNSNSLMQDRERLINLALQIAAEQDAVDEFVNLADQVGHHIPNDDDTRLARDEGENWDHVVRAFGRIRKEEYFYNVFSPDTIEFALAQHHGIPTRLVDWTYSPFIAAFFAIEELIVKILSNKAIAVWAINSSILDKTNLKIVTHRKSKKFSYLSAQSGLFIYDILANSEYLKTGSWRSFETAIKSKADLVNETLLRKIILPASQANELLRLLSAEGITRAHLMPTLDNVTKTLATKHLPQDN